MATAAWCVSSIGTTKARSDVFDYWRERFPLWLFGPLAGLLAFVAAPGRSPTPGRWLLDAVFTLGLLAQFRLWDDLAAREHDRRTHPERILARTAAVVNYEVVCAGLGLANLLVASLRGPDFTGLVALLALDVSLGVWYARRRARSAAGDLLVLAKYPMFVAVVAAGTAMDRAAVGPGMASAYAAAVLVEALHDPTSPLRPTNVLSRGRVVR
jgi:hypothetical protein